MLRVTVASGSRRVDLALPSSVPVAELVPELARSVGLLDARSAPGGYHLRTLEGRPLSPERGLAAQGVEDGGLLSVSAALDDPPPRVHDDVAEALGDVVRDDLAPWGPEAGERMALVAAALLAVLGAGGLLVQGGSQTAAICAAAVAAVLVGSATALVRTGPRGPSAVVAAWLATSYAGVAGALLAGDGAGRPLAGAGAGALVAGLLALAGLGGRRTRLVPAAVVGAGALGTGLLVRAGGVDVRVVLVAGLVLVLLAGSLLPRLALGIAGAGPGTGPPVDLARVRADARLAQDVLLAMSATVGLLLVLVGPLAVRLGAAGTALATVACCLVMLQARRHHSAVAVLLGLSSGLAGLATVAVTVLVSWPAWRPGAAAALVVSGAVLLVVSGAGSSPSVRRARLADLAETASALVLPPLLVAASGVLSRIGG